MKQTLVALTLILLAGYLPTEERVMPVKEATEKDWNPQSFWFYPWGHSGVHKGIDIFATKGQPVVAATQGLVLYAGNYGDGGKVVYMLGPKWRFHYFAHLDTLEVKAFDYLPSGKHIGSVGNSGNAKGKPAHLHYSIKTLLPQLQPINNVRHAYWQRRFYLDPGAWLGGCPRI